MGDSRAVLGLRGGVCRRVSADHKPSLDSERQRIESQGGFVKIVSGVARVMGELAVCRALGDAHLKPYISCDPDIFEVRFRLSSTPLIYQLELTHDECFLILACDGIWDDVTDEEAVELVHRSEDPLTASHRILNLAHTRGSTDNLSIIVIYLSDRTNWKYTPSGSGPV